jgi:hypothetical protein
LVPSEGGLHSIHDLVADGIPLGRLGQRQSLAQATSEILRLIEAALRQDPTFAPANGAEIDD